MGGKCRGDGTPDEEDAIALYWEAKPARSSDVPGEVKGLRAIKGKKKEIKKKGQGVGKESGAERNGRAIL